MLCLSLDGQTRSCVLSLRTIYYGQPFTSWSLQWEEFEPDARTLMTFLTTEPWPLISCHLREHEALQKVLNK